MNNHQVKTQLKVDSKVEEYVIETSKVNVIAELHKVQLLQPWSICCWFCQVGIKCYELSKYSSLYFWYIWCDLLKTKVVLYVFRYTYICTLQSLTGKYRVFTGKLGYREIQITCFGCVQGLQDDGILTYTLRKID